MKQLFITISNFVSNQTLEEENPEYGSSAFVEVCNVTQLKTWLKKHQISSEEYEYIISYIDSKKQRNIEEILSYLKDAPINLTMYGSLDSILDYLEKHEYLKKYRFMVSPHQYRSINYEELLEINQYVTNIVNYVKHFELSPFEQTLFVADLVRELEYKMADQKPLSVSRDLIEIIHQDYIVCLGYANLYQAILEKLHIKTSVVSYERELKEENGKGHAANYVTIKDDKYDIDGPFVYDLTWDSNKGDMDFLNSYNYIAIPTELDRKIKSLLYQFDDVKSKDEKMRIEHSIRKFTRTDLPDTLLDTFFSSQLVQVKHLAFRYKTISFEAYLKEKNIDFKKKKGVEKFNILYDYYKDYIKNQFIEIPNTTFLKALYSVKRVEMSIDKEKYYFIPEDLLLIMGQRIQFLESVKYAKSKNDIKHELNGVERFLLTFGEGKTNQMCDQTMEEIEHQLETYYKQSPGEAMDKDNAMMELLSVLRQVAGQDVKNPVKEGRKLK